MGLTIVSEERLKELLHNELSPKAAEIIKELIESPDTNVNNPSEAIICMHYFILELMDELAKTAAGKAYIEKGIKVMK